MDQAQSRALEALQPFIHLTTSSTASSPRFIANIITNATSNPNTFVFSELLETPAVQSLRSPETPEEYRRYLKLLEIFAWGTWSDYKSTPGLPDLSSEQALKLRLLSLLTISSTTRPLTYRSLMEALSIPNASELESLVTTAIYSSLIKARLSPASNPPTVNVTAVAPLRDVQPQTISSMISILANWEGRCGDVINGIEAEIAKIKAEAVKNRKRELARMQTLERAIANGSADSSASRGGKNSKANNTRGSKTGSRPGAQASGSSNNKREYSGDDVEEDDGYFDNGSDGGVDTLGSHMDIDEGMGATRATSATATRQAKRLLGVGRKS